MENYDDIETFKKLIDEAQNSSKENNTTFNFSHKKIKTVPKEIINIIKDKAFRNLYLFLIKRLTVFRLTLGHNQLSFFPDEIGKLSRLRYLNIRANIFKEFPVILCDLPSLEILDISRNKIRCLPNEFGNLMSLKVLSISRNKLKVLPIYISKMSNLKILKIDHNPITFPPKEIIHFEGGEKEMLPWLNNVKSFLSSHEEYFSDHGEEQYLVSEGEKDNFYNVYQNEKKINMSSKIQHPILTNKTSISLSSSEKGSQKSIKDTQEKEDTLFSFSTLSTRKSSNNSENKGHQNSIKKIENKINTYNPKKIFHDPETVDSSINNHTTFKFSKNNVQRNTEAYFKRFSALPEAKRILLKSIKVMETYRGILFSLSQVYQGIRQYIVFCTDPSIKGTINLFLCTANIHIGALTNALEEHETKDHCMEPSIVISTCCTCIEAFKQVIEAFHKHIKKITIKADIRYTRTLLLILYGATIEIRNSWMILMSVLPPTSFNVDIFSFKNHSSGNFTSSHHPTFRSLSNISIANSATSTINTSNISPNSMQVLSNLNQAELPNTHTSSIITQYLELADMSKTDTDEHLFEKILTATTAALSILTLLENAATKNTITESEKSHSTTTNFEITKKLKELATMSINARGIAQKVKNQLKNIKENSSLNYKRKFWEDINAFVKSIIAIAALAKIISTEFSFSKLILSGLSTVTRSTKELTILLSISSFRFTAESQTTNVPLTTFSDISQETTAPISTNSIT
ncbi:hypothetical protein T552_01089 [Pneumocystis carinii B80]|uniref:Disease resistance R13L4/SHOC-2-like LRR domain-containing protein n=1 Tax=Pneumocystis carinii (strain B80) TaxID=1408658 RepID=A0A0W4ZNC6_PNEC8|nr:hypothetical protein T552_01089 [Pneumocystis carinii B80]KTW29885.1 hypothetical protein T552_01089 [Pneumocystis carinii B80]